MAKNTEDGIKSISNKNIASKEMKDGLGKTKKPLLKKKKVMTSDGFMPKRGK